MGELTGRVAAISGGLGDIGRAVALELAGRGASISVCDLLPVGASSGLGTAVRALGVPFHYAQTDVSDHADVSSWLADASSALGTPDLIIPNAAVVTITRLMNLTANQWRRELQINLDGAFHLSHEGARRLIAEGKPGWMVFVGSWVAHAPRPHIPAYCVSKAGLRMLMKLMALELAPHKIMVNEVAPGNVDGGLSAKVFAERPELREGHIQMVPIKRLQEPAEIALQVAHLCSPTNTQMTGSTLLVDGGLSLLTDAPHDDV